MDAKCKAKLLNCRSFAEAKPILETLNLSTSGEELARTAYQIRETQPSVAEHFLRTVVREADDIEVKKADTDKHEHVKETDDNTDSQSTSTTGLEKIGKEESAPEGAPAQPDQKDQMGVSINEAFPPMGGAPPNGAGSLPPVPPVAENGLPPAGGAPPPPPMPPAAPPAMPAPQQMMRYTISETMKVINPQLRKIAEAIMALDKKVQETAMSQVKSLNLGERMGMTGKPQLIRETTGDVKTDLGNQRQSIKQMNDAIKDGLIS